ncbi:MAG TPA: TetR/AcrR family transcriptional regulator [Acidimicrobiales bacterium]
MTKYGRSDGKELKMARKKSLGRPPGANSDETRRRILEVARHHIAERGYAGATLKEISREVGLTSGAIYYYYGSKQQLVEALITENHEVIQARFEAAAASAEMLPAKLVAVFEATQEIMDEQPDIARFSVTMRSDASRHGELKSTLDKSSRAYFGFYRKLVGDAIEAGEIAPDLDSQEVADMCTVISLGVTALAVQVPSARHRRAIRAVERLVEGTLFSPAATKSLARGNGR